MYTQTRRFNAAKVREVVTRDDSNGKVAFPYYRDVTVCWEPNDSIHGGKLFLQHRITRRPVYVECCPPGNAPPTWVVQLKKVEDELEGDFRCSVVFDDEQVQQWRSWMRSMAWKGNSSIDPQHLPEFHIPDFPSRPPTEEDRHHNQAMALLQQAGMDPSGNLRAYYKDGQDQLTYPRDQSLITYGNRHLNGQKYDAATTGKRKRSGEA